MPLHITYCSINALHLTVHKQLKKCKQINKKFETYNHWLNNIMNTRKFPASD